MGAKNENPDEKSEPVLRKADEKLQERPQHQRSESEVSTQDSKVFTLDINMRLREIWV